MEQEFQESGQVGWFVVNHALRLVIANSLNRQLEEIIYQGSTTLGKFGIAWLASSSLAEKATGAFQTGQYLDIV